MQIRGQYVKPVAMTVFCDWLSCYQEHTQGGLPVLNNGCVAEFEADSQTQFIDPETGEYRTIFDASKVTWTTQKHFDYEGSYSTKIRIKCDGYRITFDGNIGRFGRPDNLFGYSVLDCIIRANDVLALLGLPPFTPKRGTNLSNGSIKSGGCVITRVDLTKNYATGSDTRAKRLIHFMAGQDSGRRASAKQYGENGVTWNEGSKYWYSKIYLKVESLGDHASDELRQWTLEQGIVRHEVSLKSRWLTQKGFKDITAWIDRNKTDMYEGEIMENVVYGKFNEILERGTATRTPLEDIPKVLGRIARDWRSGIDVWGDSNYGVRTRRRWRSQLLAYGIDIKQPSSVTRLPIRLEVIQLQAAVAPSWYWNQSQTLRAA